jgi:probable DNA repair protein
MDFNLGVLSFEEALAEGARIVTVNNRLAKHLRARGDSRLGESGQTVWSSVDVLPLSSWLRRCHADLIDLGAMRRRLLSAFEETLVWERMIASSRYGGSLLRLKPAAQAAADAYRLMIEWRLELPPAASAETAAFLAWRQAFEAECRNRAWLPAARLIEEVNQAIEAHTLQAEQSLVLAGFDELTPNLRRLLQTLAHTGAQLASLAEPANPAPPNRFVAPDLNDEIQAAVAWAMARHTADTDARIAIVAPHLADMRRHIDDRFAHAARTQAPCNTVSEPALHEFSLGAPLSDYPIVNDALVALDLALGDRPQATVSEFLRSPFFGRAEREHGARAVFDGVLRRSLRPSYGLAYMLEQLRRTAAHAAHSCPGLQRTLEAYATLVRALPDRTAPSNWAAAFAAGLQSLGWPGDRPLNSAEYQTATRWQELLLEFARLDALAQHWTLTDALHHLRELARKTLSQPAGRGAPIQILGLLEAAGMTFDHLWVLGLDDERWPPIAEPNPLLPFELQCRHQLPHASAEREWHFAEGITRRLVAAAREVVLSCAQHRDDRDLRPSPLLLDFAAIARDQLGIAAPAEPPVAFGNDLFEWVNDATAPPPAPRVAGGAQLLSAQSACPFSAVARFRLNAASPETGLQEPDARLQGHLIHRSLELLWRDLADQQTLLQCSPSEREARVHRAVDQALQEARRERPDLYGPQFRALEQQRLGALVGNWLTLEGARATFAVRALETRADINLGRLTIQTRGDRIDRLADGRQVVIDYKTSGQISIADWTEERLEQPQVPLYCLLDDGPIAAAAIAQVNARQMAWHGLAAADGLLPEVPALDHPKLANWQELLAHWHSALHRLGNEIADGCAAATPSTAACQYCRLSALCRRQDSNRPGAGPAAND